MTKKPKRPQLTRNEVVSTGLAIGDAEGLAAISLRRIATELGVTPMALYRYVESKEALLDALLETAYGEVELPDSAEGQWWEGLSAVAGSARRALLRHPAAAAVAVSRARAGPNALRIIECILGLLRRAGLDTEHAVRVHTAFTRLLIGLIALEASLLPELSDEERRQQARQTLFELESLPPSEFPNLIEAAPYIATPYEPEKTFQQGLDLLRAGIEARLPPP
jgi:TetR/AcrR family tetracycline transcriptional repressor